MLIDHRIWRAWDFSPLYGLVIGGGAGYPVSNQVWGYLTDVEISTNYAIDFNSLPSLFYFPQQDAQIFLFLDINTSNVLLCGFDDI